MALVPKIKIEISFNELCEVLEALSELNSNVLSKSERATINILELVTISLLKKQIDKRHEAKVFNIALEYFEAYFLEKYLKAYNAENNEHYVQTVINKINQKLA